MTEIRSLSPPAPKATTIALPRTVTRVMAAGLSLAVAARHGFSAEGLLLAGVAAVLVELSAIDLRERLLPNRIVLPAAALTLAVHLAIDPQLEWLFAALICPLVLAVPLVFDRKAIGMGDVKLGLLLGATLGAGVVTALLVGFLAVAVLGGGLLLTRGVAARRTVIPLGPFLAFGAIVVLLGGAP